MSMMVCILGSNKEERAPEAEDEVNETRWPSAKSSHDLQVFKSTSFVCFFLQEETVDQTDKQK